MQQRSMRVAAALTALLLCVLCCVIPAFAELDNSYRFDEYEMSISFPKSYYVITRDTSADDGVFEALGFDYDSTKAAFDDSDICLFAYDGEKTLRISMSVTKDSNSEDINNYADISAGERQAIVDEFNARDDVSSAREVKHKEIIYICYDLSASDGEDGMIKVCSTIVNGLRIELTLQKENEPITGEEEKVLTNAAESLTFDKINHKGAIFTWWRIALWLAILAAVSVAVTVGYKRYHAVKKRREEEHFERRAAQKTEEDTAIPAHAQIDEITFEESLGYQDDEEFAERADADEMATYDISVQEKDPAMGVALFEDEGSGIDDGSDYFDTYFREPVEKRRWYQRLFSAIGSNLKIAAKHTGYFFLNLYRKLKRLFRRWYVRLRVKLRRKIRKMKMKKR